MAGLSKIPGSDDYHQHNLKIVIWPNVPVPGIGQSPNQLQPKKTPGKQPRSAAAIHQRK